jgi:hypothetical protein
MKIYEDYSQSLEGWNVTSTLQLEDDGRFFYSEGWTDYTNASLSGGAAGSWSRGVRVIVFRVDWVDGTMYFPWAQGQELIARLCDGALNFGRGWILRPPSPRWEYTVKTPVSNNGTVPLTLVLEPWGMRHTLAPGERVEVVAEGRWWEGEPKVERRAEEMEFDGRNGSWATVVPQPPLHSPPPKPESKTKPPAPARTTRAKAPKRIDKPSGMSPVKASVRPRGPRFVPRTPSPELAALIRRWVEELPEEGMINRLCKENDAVRLDCTEIYLWVLRTDGQVLCIDHESFAQRQEPEDDAEVAYGKIEVAAKTHPELLELLPPDRGWPG